MGWEILWGGGGKGGGEGNRKKGGEGIDYWRQEDTSRNTHLPLLHGSDSSYSPPPTPAKKERFLRSW